MSRRNTPLRLRLGAAILLLGAMSGCATRGPLHLYTFSASQPSVIHDLDASGAAVATIPTFLSDNERLIGLAYDPFTDHLFLRLAPGNRIRVVDRPARAIKREFTIAELPDTGGGDLAVNPRNGHLFLAHPSEHTLIEITRYGSYVRSIRLEGLESPIAGVAYDGNNGHLLILTEAGPARLSIHGLSGAKLRELPVVNAGMARGLAFHPQSRELFSIGAAGTVVIVNNADGGLERTVTAPRGVPAEFIDVGERSLIRVF